MPHTLLLAEDDPVTQQLMKKLLRNKLGYEVVTADNGKQAVAELGAHNHDRFTAIILDIDMPYMDGFEVLSIARTRYPNIPVIMLTGDTATTTAVKAVKLGAFDYLSKPVDATHLQVVLKNAIHLSMMSGELARVKRKQTGGLYFTDMVGHQSGLAQCIKAGMKAAHTHAPVMISGETGTGKELFARAIHGQSTRAGKPFIAINCGAIPETLIESILFGHEKGAFTGATDKTLGKFREAEGGTIFLDELGELPLEAQVKLLRVLQEGEVEPVGAAQPVKVDVRIISATNRDVERQVSQQRFREDLFFRLNVLPIYLPPLNQRGEDIILLAEHFLQQASLEDTAPLKRLGADARKYLLQCQFSGNIRELANLMRRASIWCDGERIGEEDLRALNPSSNHANDKQTHVAAHSPNNYLALIQADGRHKTLAQIEAELLQTTLKAESNNMTRAAETLGIARSTFYRKIKQLAPMQHN